MCFALDRADFTATATGRFFVGGGRPIYYLALLED